MPRGWGERPAPGRIRGITMPYTTILKPAAGAAVLLVTPGQTIAFEFDPSGVSFERAGGDLVLSFDSGGQVTLSGFFVADDAGSLPGLRLLDGRTVDAGDFLRTIDAGFNVSAAAGPQLQAQLGGDIFRDDVDALLNGMADRNGTGAGNDAPALHAALDANSADTAAMFLIQQEILTGFGG